MRHHQTDPPIAFVLMDEKRTFGNNIGGGALA